MRIRQVLSLFNRTSRTTTYNRLYSPELPKPPYNLLKSTPQPPQKQTLTEKSREFIKEYGKLGVVVYLSMSAISISSFYLLLRSGVDIKSLIKKTGLPESAMWDSAGTFAMAYACHKILLPVRLFLTVGITRYIARRFPSIPYLSKSTTGEAKR